jgi:mRNA interferase MazF
LIWRGEIYDVDLGQPVGHEPAFVRPAVIVSVDVLNNGPGELVTVVPVGSRAYGLRSHVELETGVSGLDHVSYARCDQLRTISRRRLAYRRGVAGPGEMAGIDQTLRFVLDL